MFGADGDLAPLEALVELAHAWEIRLLVDEGHAIGTIGPDGRGALAEQGLEDQVDVIIGALDNALGSAGAFVACDELMARYLAGAARTFRFASALPPPAAAGALAALELLETRPQLVDRLRENAWTLRAQLEHDGFALPPTHASAPIISLVLTEPELAVHVAEAALARGVFVQAIVPPAVAPAASGLRLTVMASHRPGELRAAARVLAAATRDAGLQPARSLRESTARVFDFEARAA